MATKNVPAKKESTAVANWQDRLAAMAKASTQQESSVATGQFISTKAGQLTWQGSPAKENKFKVIILDAILENAYYPGDFDPENPQPPVCFAFGRDDKELAPHESSAEPQSEKCDGCKMNEFGTAERGKGKACKNIRRLGMVAADPLSAEGIQKSEVAYMKTPVTSVKSWAAYARSLDALKHLPPLGVITEVGSVPDPKSQFKLTFNYVEDVPQELLGAVLDRHEEVKESIGFPYSPPSSEAPAKKPAGKQVKRKF